MALLAMRAPYRPAFACAKHEMQQPRVSTQGGVRVDVSGLAPLKTEPFVVEFKDLQAYIDLLDPLIESLDRDVYRTLVYADPKPMEEKAAELGDSSISSFVKKKLLDEAAKLRERMKGKSQTQVDNEIYFATNWRPFYDRWQKNKKEVMESKLRSGGDLWNQIKTDDLQYQQFDEDYKGLGYKTTKRKPPSPEQSWSDKIPWGWIIAGFVLVGAAMLLGQVRGIARSAAGSSS